VCVETPVIRALLEKVESPVNVEIPVTSSFWLNVASVLKPVLEFTVSVSVWESPTVTLPLSVVDPLKMELPVWVETPVIRTLLENVESPVNVEIPVTRSFWLNVASVLKPVLELIVRISV